MTDRVAGYLAMLLVSSGVVIGVAAIAASCLRRESAALRHRVWSAALIIVLVLPVLRVALPPLRVHVPVRKTDTERIVLGFAPFSAGAATSVRRSSPMHSESAEPRSSENRTSIDWTTSITAIWLAGVAVLLTRLAVAHRRARRIAASSRRVDDRLRLRGTELRISGDVATPIVVGIVRTIVILPESAERWNDETLNAVLTHELGHVERWDAVFALVAHVVCAVYWCNPLTWIAASAMMREAERACDDRVVRGGADPTSYGRLLLEFAASTRNRLAVPVTATAMTRTSEVEARLLAVLDPTIRREGPSRRLDVAIGSAASILAIAFAAIRLDAAPPLARPREVVQSPAQLEPDRRADSLASPASERVPWISSDARVRSALTAALAGRDSMLATMLRTGLAHRPQSSGDLVSERSAWALSQERNGELVAPLLDSLRSRDWRVQAYAAWALGHARIEGVDARLAPLLDHPVWRVRAMVASVLHGTRNAEARQRYVRALSDDAWQVRAAAVEHFAAVRDAGVLDRLRALSNDRHVAVRNAVAAALASR